MDSMQNGYGQVPRAAIREMNELVMTPPKKFKPAMLLDHNEPRLSVDSVLNGLGFDPAKQNDWRKFLQKALHLDSEVVMRRDLMSKMREEKLNPELRKALFQRSMSYYRGRFQKSVEVVSIDALYKAEPKGGKYHRRVMGKGGKYRYYYDKEKYERSKDAHLDGDTAARKAIKSNVHKILESSGDNGCDVKQFQGLVKRYGSKMCGEVMKGMQSEGLTYKGGKLYLQKKNKGETKAPKKEQ